MKVLLDIQDDKAESLMDVIHSLPYVKTKTLSPANSRFLKELKEAVEEVKLIKAGKLKGRPAKELLDEL